MLFCSSSVVSTGRERKAPGAMSVIWFPSSKSRFSWSSNLRLILSPPTPPSKAFEAKACCSGANAVFFFSVSETSHRIKFTVQEPFFTRTVQPQKEILNNQMQAQGRRLGVAARLRVEGFNNQMQA